MNRKKTQDINSRSFYHGSPYRIDRFSLDFCGKGTDQSGSGIYVTTDKYHAMGYCQQNEQKRTTFSGAHEDPCLYKVKLSVKSALGVNDIRPLTRHQVRQIMVASPSLDDALWNFGDLGFESRDKVMNRAIEGYAHIDDTPVLRVLHMLSNDFFDGHVREFNKALLDVLGYDHIIDEIGDHLIVNVLDDQVIEILSRTPYERLRQQMEPGLGM